MECTLAAPAPGGVLDRMTSTALRPLPLLLLLAAAARPAGAADDRHRFVAVADEPIRVAFLVSEGATLIDFAGPWEVFQDVMVDAAGKPIRTMAQMESDPGARHPFTLYTVAESKAPMRVSGGLGLVPDHTFADAPAPDLVVVPAHRASDAELAWLRKVSGAADLTMSVCTGASVLARAGLLDGQRATTHAWFVEPLGQRFRKATFVAGARFVESGRVASSAGLSAGIDLALRVVERYLGREVAAGTAEFMEYQGEGWKVPGAEPLARRRAARRDAPPAPGR